MSHLSAEFDAFVRTRTAPLLRAAYFLTGEHRQHHAEPEQHPYPRVRRRPLAAG